jgi:hypothetical protein
VPGADKPGYGAGRDHLQVYAVGMLIDERQELDAQDGDFFVYAFDFAGFFQLKLLSFVKNLAVEAVLAGVLVAFGGIAQKPPFDDAQVIMRMPVEDLEEMRLTEVKNVACRNTAS